MIDKLLTRWRSWKLWQRVAFFLSSCILVVGLGALLMKSSVFSTPTGQDHAAIDWLNPQNACDFKDPACLPYLRGVLEANRPTPRRLDPRVKALLLADSAIQAMVAGRKEGIDYWMDLNPIANGAHGDEGAGVSIMFAKPVSYDGVVNIASDPCSGHGQEGGIDPNDPCLKEPRQFGSKQASVVNARIILAQVDVKKGEVFNIYHDELPPAVVDEMIHQLYQTPSPTIAQTPAQVPP